MRIIAGSHKGRSLLSPKAHDLRPTSGRVKEALFSILGDRVSGAWLLDLFAGTGAIGIEAMSRGAERVVFVEAHAESLRLLRANLSRCALLDRTDIYRGDTRSYLQEHSNHAKAFDIIFADPPYCEDCASTLLPLLGCNAMIRPHTVVILEHPTTAPIPHHAGSLSRVRQYRYGDTTLSLFRMTDPEAAAS